MNKDRDALVRWPLLALYSIALTAGQHFYQQGDLLISLCLLFVIGLLGGILVTYGSHRDPDGHRD